MQGVIRPVVAVRRIAEGSEDEIRVAEAASDEIQGFNCCILYFHLPNGTDWRTEEIRNGGKEREKVYIYIHIYNITSRHAAPTAEMPDWAGLRYWAGLIHYYDASTSIS